LIVIVIWKVYGYEFKQNKNKSLLKRKQLPDITILKMAELFIFASQY